MKTLLIILGCIILGTVLYFLYKWYTKKGKVLRNLGSNTAFSNGMSSIFTDIIGILHRVVNMSETAYNFLFKNDPKWENIKNTIDCLENNISETEKQKLLEFMLKYYVEFLQANPVTMSSMVNNLYNSDKGIYNALVSCGLINNIGEMLFIMYQYNNREKYPFLARYIVSCSRYINWSDISNFDMTEENKIIKLIDWNDSDDRQNIHNSKLHRCFTESGKETSNIIFTSDITGIFDDVMTILYRSVGMNETIYNSLFKNDPKWQNIKNAITCLENNVSLAEKTKLLEFIQKYYDEFLRANPVTMSGLVNNLYNTLPRLFNALIFCGLLDNLGEMLFVMYQYHNRIKYPDLPKYLTECSRKLNWTNINSFDITPDNINIKTVDWNDLESITNRFNIKNSTLAKCLTGDPSIV